jgi:hypothetical protein
VIGEQSQMYEAKARQTLIDLDYPHSLVRNIVLTIPDGYQVKNLKDLNINTVYRNNDQVMMGFSCSYEQEGNVLKIKIVEDYRDLTYPVKVYDDFKNVINAAADFNKVVLILDKAG